MSLHQCLINTHIRNHVYVLSRRYVKGLNRPTAGIIVIGDEILKAQVKDTNSHYICNLLYKCGIQVKKISVISDDVEEISKEIKDASNKYTYVITSGGIGPTHDDVTYKGLAKAFNDKLHYHPKLVDIIKNHFMINDALSPVYKIAQIPEKASLKFGLNTNINKPNSFPYITLENIYVFPGSPVFLEKSFQNLYEELLSTNKRFVKEEVFIDAREDLFANALSTVVKEFPNVSFGSYPVNNCRQFYQNPERVLIYFDSSMESSVVIHLAHICKTQLHSDNKLQVVYFKKEMPVDMEEFIKEMVDKYNLIMYTVETAVDNKINKIVQLHLRPTLLIGKVEESGESKINSNYNSMDNVNQLQIDNPLHNWTKKDVWTFASSLYLPCKLTA
ncbi:FAD synthase isoform X3 [Temnothorax americanus]|uniref:FAD synthase isoform X3 n=1 Tax=Temnothorax americanus TaxID=1964332 RepID=UPI004067AC84